MKNKLHLGCGQKYLEGYRNIDFPSESHSLQAYSVADEHCDITSIKYKLSSIDEIRLHHVYEHFPKIVAFVLLAIWRQALKPGGELVIEVPDMKMQSLYSLVPSLGCQREFLSSRHLFGSQEAAWASHYEGYTPKMLKFIFRNFGFENIKIRRNFWRGTFNFVIRGNKSKDSIDFEKSARNCFEMYLVDSSSGELKLKELWTQGFIDTLKSKSELLTT